jgi:hypothetical protein
VRSGKAAGERATAGQGAAACEPARKGGGRQMEETADPAPSHTLRALRAAWPASSTGSIRASMPGRAEPRHRSGSLGPYQIAGPAGGGELGIVARRLETNRRARVASA